MDKRYTQDPTKEQIAQWQSQDRQNLMYYTKPDCVVPVDIQTTQELVNDLTAANDCIRELAEALRLIEGTAGEADVENVAATALTRHAAQIEKAKA